ncbi:MAG: rhomboid family intramembrane serine protease [Candidatus Baltobacteraceae bacterium]
MIPLSDERRPAGFAPAVWAIVAASAYVYWREIDAPRVDYVINEFALVPYNFTHGIQLPPPSPHPFFLTIVTSMFLHGGFLHLFFNMLFLLVFGPRMERSLGHGGFLLTYLVCGIAGGLAQIWSAPGSHIPDIGASGAIAGILGAFIVSYPTAVINTVTPIGCFPLLLRLPAVLVIGLWAAMQFFLGFQTLDPRANQGGTAYFAHIGGFACGAILTGLRNRRHGAA